MPKVNFFARLYEISESVKPISEEELWQKMSHLYKKKSSLKKKVTLVTTHDTQTYLQGSTHSKPDLQHANSENGQPLTTPTNQTEQKKEPLPQPIFGQENSAVEEEYQPPQLTAREKRLVKKLSEFYASIGLFVTRADMYDGVLIIKTSQERASELVMVARRHKSMMTILERLVETNDYFVLTIGHGMMLYAILAHHNRVPSDEMLLSQFGYHDSQILASVTEKPQNAPTKKTRIKREKLASTA